MEEEKKLSTVEMLKKAAEEERSGYLGFKNDIVRVLVETHKVDKETATTHVFSSIVRERMYKDFEWSLHMGPYFWAKEIAEYYMKNDL